MGDLRVEPASQIQDTPVYIKALAANSYVVPGVNFDTVGNSGVMVADTIYYQPIFVPTPDTFDRIAIQITLQRAASSGRLGIYGNSGNSPGALIVDAGAIDTTAVGIKAPVINVTLQRGLYWLAYIVSDSLIEEEYFLPCSMPFYQHHATLFTAISVGTLSKGGQAAQLAGLSDPAVAPDAINGPWCVRLRRST